MAQVPAIKWAEGDTIDYTPVAAVAAGAVVVQGGLVAIAPLDIAAGVLGALASRGVHRVPKKTGAVTAGDPIYWDAAGDPVTGTAGSGAATTSGPGFYLMGFATLDAASGDDWVYVALTPGNRTVLPLIPSATVAATGSAQGDAASIATGFTLVSGADDTKGVKLPAAVAGAICFVKSSVSNKILKVHPATGDAINALSANAAISLASGPTPAIFVAYDATTWYTFPLLPS